MSVITLLIIFLSFNRYGTKLSTEKYTMGILKLEKFMIFPF